MSVLRGQANRAIATLALDRLEQLDAERVLAPESRRQVRAWIAAIERAGPQVVASANPGCAFHLAAAGVSVKHPMDLVAEAL